jgi:TetR/AcrR family transcriptional repressor of nem operon
MIATPATDVRQHILDVARPLLLRKGFTAVGLTELLTEARVPKGSFYHYFASKEAFGQAMLEGYFADYFVHTDALLAQPGTAAQRLLAYFQDWLSSQTGDEAQRCLAVKLGAEVSDLSEAMRGVLEQGIAGVIERLARCVEAGRRDGSLQPPPDGHAMAAWLYQSWFGASLLARIMRSRKPLDTAMANTRRVLGLHQDV